MASPADIAPPVTAPNIAAPVTAVTIGASIAASPTSGATVFIDPASIVDLSPQAQLLSQGVPTTAAANPNGIATTDQTNFEQLLVTAQLLQAQEADVTQAALLTATEAALIDAALQSTLNFSALSEAIAATGALDQIALTNMVEAAAAQSPVALPVGTGLGTTPGATTTATAAPPIATAPAPVLTPPAGAATVPNTIGNAAVLAAMMPAISMTDPAVAAAIAAYRIGSGLVAGDEDIIETTPPETGNEVMATGRLQAAPLDLHDSARDDVTHGITWNWMLTNPVNRRVARR